LRSITLSILTATAFTALFSAVADAEIVYADSLLARGGYSSDSETVIEYLRDGLPCETSPPRDERYYTRARLPFVRWEFYGYSVGALQMEKSVEAVPILISLLADPLPDFMTNDLFMKVAMESYRYRDDDWNDWTVRAQGEIMNFRAAGSRTLMDMDSEAVGAALVTVIEREFDDVKLTMQMDRDNYLYLNNYAALCRMAAVAGRREGVDALVELIPFTDRRNDGGIPYVLQHLTGAQISPPKDMTGAEFRDFVRDWQDWWDANRDSFTLPEQIAQPAATENARFETVRDYVEAASKSISHYDAVAPAYPEAHMWLENNGSKHGRKLRKLAEDENEPMELRRSAAQWYARTGGDRALRWLRTKLLAPDEQKPPKGTNIEPEYLFNAAGENFPEARNELARECVRRGVPSAPEAVDRLLSGRVAQDNAAFILEHYERLVQRFPALRHRIVQRYRYAATPGDEVVFVDCLINGDFNTAVFASAAVRSRGIENMLPENARRALQRWRESPPFALAVLEYEEDEELRMREATQISRAVTGTDVHAAQAYARAYSLLTNQFADYVTSDAEFCAQGLTRCIDAYRAWRKDSPDETGLN